MDLQPTVDFDALVRKQNGVCAVTQPSRGIYYRDILNQIRRLKSICQKVRCSKKQRKKKKKKKKEKKGNLSTLYV
jgi:hypothetical protein